MSGEDLPEGWAATTLGDCGKWTGGGTPSKGDESFWADGTVPWVSPKDMKVDDIYQAEDLITEAAVRASATSLIAKDSVLLVTRSGILQRTVPVAINRVPVTMNQDMKALTPHPGILSSFLAKFVRSRELDILAECAKAGTTVASLEFERLKAFPVALPPHPEQKRIVARLDALQARSRAAREALAEVPALLDTFRQSVLAAAFRGDLTAEWRAKNPDVEPASKLLERVRKAHGEWWASTGRKKKWEPAKALYAGDESLPELPPGWAWASSAEIVRPGTIITYGIVLPGAHVPGGVPYVRGGDIENGQILVDQLLCTAPEIAATKPDSELEPDDVLLCIIRHLKVAVVPAALRGANLTQGTVRLRCSEAASSGYLANYLASPFAQEWMKAKHFGLAMPRINVEDAREVPVPIPPKAEQVAIAEVLATAMEKLKGLENVALQHAAELDTLDQSILARAFRGELVDQDPNDEPAEALLARIRADLGSAPRRRRGGE